MAVEQDEEIEDADSDIENNSDEEEKDADAEEESDDDKSGKDSKEKEGESEDDEDDESDSDDDDNAPLTRKDLKEFKELLKSSKNRSAADRRVSGKDRIIDKSGKRPDPNAARLDSIEKRQERIDLVEEKRTFGHANNLSPAEVDVVYRMTKRPNAKALKDPAIAGAIEGIRSAERAKRNTPGGGGAPRQGRGLSAKDEAKLSPAERNDRFADRRREILADKR